jgi:hypothetical protein
MVLTNQTNDEVRAILRTAAWAEIAENKTEWYFTVITID